jgi:hypothetical protein
MLFTTVSYISIYLYRSPKDFMALKYVNEFIDVFMLWNLSSLLFHSGNMVPTTWWFVVFNKLNSVN